MTRSASGAPDAGRPFRVVLLVGFMASGKSSVGARLAARLGWDFVDADDAVEAAAGASVETLFRERGEAAFREVEARVTEELLAGRRRVVATGGGWPAAAEDRMDGLPPDVLSVWLRIPAAIAVERAARDGRVRPLLAGADPAARARELLGRRRPAYAKARLHLDASEPSPDTLAAAIVKHMREAGGRRS